MKHTRPSVLNPQFGIIAPTAYLDEYATQSRFHLVLAHLIDKDEQYTQFYRRRSEAGDFIVMDNGAFELGESYHPDRLLDLGDAVKADAIVLPDYPGQPAEKTVNAAIEHGNKIKDAGFLTFFVPQSEVGRQEDWIDAYRWAAMTHWIDIIGMSILGIPNAIPEVPKTYARVVMTKLLIDRGIFNFNKYHHYLGLNAGPALEIPALLNMSALSSLDSSGPVWAGICGQMYTPMADSYQTTRKIDKHVDFSYPMTKNVYVHQAIQTNIDLTISLFESYTDELRNTQRNAVFGALNPTELE